jgi:hypothetical protein
VDVGERDFDALVRGDVDPGNSSHSLPFFSSTGHGCPISSLKSPASRRKADARTSAPPETGGSG